MKFWKSNIKCKVKKSVMLKCFTDIDQIEQKWHHATVGQSIPPYSSTQLHIWIKGDRQRAWTSCLWKPGKNCWLRPSGCWHQSHSAKSGAIQAACDGLGFLTSGKGSGDKIRLTGIPDICHLFYTNTFLGLKILHSKVRKFTTKKASRQNSVNYTLCVRLHIPCVITPCV